jgi:hypothetical protein
MPHGCRTSYSILPAGSFTRPITSALGVPYQDWCQVQAPVQPLPGTDTMLSAPVARMASTAAWAAAAQVSVGR